MLSLFKKIGLCLVVILLTACSKHESDKKVLRVGTIAGPETRLMKVARHVAKQKYGLDIEVVQFNDYAMPNIALADGSIDANMFQHQPYLDTAIAAKGFDLVAIGKTFVYPMGLYSKKYKALDKVPDHATVAIPNDPSNGARALLLLEKAKLIKLKPLVGNYASIADISENPKQLKIVELNAAQLPRALRDVDLAAINTNYAIVANLIPSRDGLFIEDRHSPYANIVVVRKADQNNPKFKQLMEALHARAVLDTADNLFFGEAIPAWETRR